MSSRENYISAEPESSREPYHYLYVRTTSCYMMS
ncbi:unnamed protein product [Amoebophrya sp. A25]|nr:unnamed protein product [Amoebophrya sp. A25]|eukprot:GSA25T00002467001.1